MILATAISTQKPSTKRRGKKTERNKEV